MLNEYQYIDTEAARADFDERLSHINLPTKDESEGE
jgi:hypothetical protein